MVRCPIAAALNKWFYCLRGKCQNKNFAFWFWIFFFLVNNNNTWGFTFTLTAVWKVKAKTQQHVTLHCPESLSCVEIMKLASPSPPHYKWSDLWWPGPGFPQKTPELRALLFLCEPDRQWWCYCRNAFGKLGFRWVSVCSGLRSRAGFVMGRWHIVHHAESAR